MLQLEMFRLVVRLVVRIVHDNYIFTYAYILYYYTYNFSFSLCISSKDADIAHPDLWLKI